MTTPEMYVALYDYITSKLIVPNVTIPFLNYESDILYVTNSDYLNEIEIKVSLSDIKADLKKKHNHDDPKVRNVFFAIPNELYDKAKKFIPIEYGILLVDKITHKYTDYLISGYSVYKVRNPKTRKEVGKLTRDEKYNLARIGSMKILWKQRRDLESEGYYNYKEDR